MNNNRSISVVLGPHDDDAKRQRQKQFIKGHFKTTNLGSRVLKTDIFVDSSA